MVLEAPVPRNCIFDDHNGIPLYQDYSCLLWQDNDRTWFGGVFKDKAKVRRFRGVRNRDTARPLYIVNVRFKEGRYGYENRFAKHP